MNRRHEFPHSKTALEELQLSQPTLNKMLDEATTDEEVQQAILEEKEALNKVRRAFYKDTRDRNSLDNCLLADVPWIAEVVRKEDERLHRLAQEKDHNSIELENRIE